MKSDKEARTRGGLCFYQMNHLKNREDDDDHQNSWLLITLRLLLSWYNQFHCFFLLLLVLLPQVIIILCYLGPQNQEVINTFPIFDQSLFINVSSYDASISFWQDKEIGRPLLVVTGLGKTKLPSSSQEKVQEKKEVIMKGREICYFVTHFLSCSSSLFR